MTEKEKIAELINIRDHFNYLAHNLCKSCTNIGCEFQSGIVRTECAFYMPPHIEPDNCGNYVVQEPTTKNCESCEYYGSHHEVCNYCYKCSLWTEKGLTTKNDLPHCQHTDEEIAKSFIEDVETVKDQLPCGEHMDFPDTFDEFAKDYGFKDKDEVYTNGSELIPVFRVKQWLEHISTTKNDIRDNGVKDELNGAKNELEPTTKNNLAVDCISRADAIKAMQDKAKELKNEDTINGLCGAVAILYEMPPITPIRPKGHWIDEGFYAEGHSEHAFMCSKCSKHYIGYVGDFKWCPNCGSDNREVTE